MITVLICTFQWWCLDNRFWEIFFNNTIFLNKSAFIHPYGMSCLIIQGYMRTQKGDSWMRWVLNRYKQGFLSLSYSAGLPNWDQMSMVTVSWRFVESQVCIARSVASERSVVIFLWRGKSTIQISTWCNYL